MQNYIEHHGILGMKWGVRRYQNKDGSLTSAGKRRNQQVAVAKGKMDSAKSILTKSKGDRQSAAKTYDKSISKAQMSLPFGKKAKARWDKVYNDLETYQKKNDAYKTAKSNYKNAKRLYKTERKAAINRTSSEINKNASLLDKMVYNDATRRRAAQYIVDANMSVSDAKKKATGDAWRNTAIFMAAMGAVSVASVATFKR